MLDPRREARVTLGSHEREADVILDPREWELSGLASP